MADPPLGKSAALAAAERKSLLINLTDKLTPSSDPQPLQGAKASRELRCPASRRLPPNGCDRERKESRLALTALGDNYSTSGLKPGPWTDNLMYRAPHRRVSGSKGARD